KPEDEPYKIIGEMHYHYYNNIRSYLSRKHNNVNTHQLVLSICKYDDNTKQLKWMMEDDKWILLKFNNLNTSAWRLDLEKAILIHDQKQE
ncbi:CDP-diacylglycerol--serine O-phosphatidyltransferase, partial [Salmonella enterica]